MRQSELKINAVKGINPIHAVAPSSVSVLFYRHMSKDWDKWPPDVNSRFDEMIRKQEMKKAQKDADIAKASGASLEWHVPTKEKAIELEKMFEKYDVEGIDIIVTPK